MTSRGRGARILRLEGRTNVVPGRAQRQSSASGSAAHVCANGSGAGWRRDLARGPGRARCHAEQAERVRRLRHRSCKSVC
jgi:hypothetical protein